YARVATGLRELGGCAAAACARLPRLRARSRGAGREGGAALLARPPARAAAAAGPAARAGTVDARASALPPPRRDAQRRRLAAHQSACAVRAANAVGGAADE